MAYCKTLEHVYYKGVLQPIGTVIKNPGKNLLDKWLKGKWVKIIPTEDVQPKAKTSNVNNNPDDIPFPKKYKVIAENQVFVENTKKALAVDTVIDEQMRFERSIKQMLNYGHIQLIEG